jgi:NAD(P)H-flavin reductase
VSTPIKIRAIVTKVEDHGEGTYTIVLRPEARVPRFKPGQFLHLTVDEYDPAGGFWPESRVFSIASSPGTDSLTIVYSVKGRYTRRMESLLVAGVPVWLKLPYGTFTIESMIGAGQDVVLIAGGTGISPFVPYLESLSRKPLGNATKLYYGARTAGLILFRELLDGCADATPGFDLQVFIEDGVPDALLLKRGNARSGRLSADTVRTETLGMKNPAYFLSGPPAMIRSFKERMGSMGVKADDMKIDEWE